MSRSVCTVAVALAFAAPMLVTSSAAGQETPASAPASEPASAPASAPNPEALAAVQKQIVETWQKHRSIKAKVSVSLRTEAEGTPVSGEGGGAMELAQAEGKTQIRLDLRITTSLTRDGQTMQVDQTSLSVDDGEFEYRLTEQGDRRSATKSKRNPARGLNPRELFSNLGPEARLALLPDEKIGEIDVFVLEATNVPRTGGSPFSTVRYYFGKTNGVLVRESASSDDGKNTRTVTLSEFVFDEPLDPARFTWQTPEGVELQDRTGG